MSTVQGFTAAQLLNLPDDGLRRELIHGEVRVKSPSIAWHGKIAARVAAALFNFVQRQQLGSVFAAETGFLLATDPDHVRAPDVSFVAAGRDVPETGFFPGPPDLAVEVISPGDTYGEVEEKVLDWLAHGTRRVVVVDPRTRTATIHDADGSVARFNETQTLDGGKILSGWSLPLSEIFAQ